jgi:hypothetical protein
MDAPKEAKINKIALNNYSTALRKEFKFVEELNSMACQSATERAWLSIDRFYQNCKKKVSGKKGYPRFQKDNRSVEYKTSGWSLNPSKRRITFTDKKGIGEVKLLGKWDIQTYPVKLIKRVRLLKKADGFYCQFCVDVDVKAESRVADGEIGLDVCKNMEEKDFAEFTIMNRTIEKAEKIAAGKELFRVAPITDLWKEIAAADIIISSVRTDSPIITQAEVKKLQLLSFKYFIDLSVPRSIEDGIEKINGVLLYNIDTLKERADEALATRLASIPDVRTSIEESIISFNDWSKEMEVSPTIHKLKNALEQIRKEEMNRHMKGLTKEETEKLEKITAGLVQKIIKQPIIHLKAACKRGDSDKMVDVLNDLFNLESFEEIES